MRFDIVKMCAETRSVAPDTYHHGNLPSALRAAAADLLTEGGVAGFSLREVARRAGVSHAAPAHHFGDAAGLLTAVAVEGFGHLTDVTSRAAASTDDPVLALARVGRAYVEVAQSHPGHCAVLFREDAVDTDDAAYEESGLQAFGVLVGAVERVAEAVNPDLDIELASALCWSMVQGLLTVHAPLQSLAEKRGAAVPPIGDLAEAIVGLAVSGWGSAPRPGP